MEVPIDAVGGRVTIRYREDGGKEKAVEEPDVKASVPRCTKRLMCASTPSMGRN